MLRAIQARVNVVSAQDRELVWPVATLAFFIFSTSDNYYWIRIDIHPYDASELG